MEHHREAKENVKKIFGENAEKYVASESHAKGDDLPLLVEWLHPQKEWVALDIATGGGHVAKNIAPHVNCVFATDLTKPMLENTSTHLKEHFKNIWFMIADAESLPFLDNTFDMATCRIAPHHFPNPDQFIREVYRVLKPHGKFVLIDNVVPSDKKLGDFMNGFEKLRDESHVRCLSIHEWKSLFEGVGFMEIQSLNRKKKHDYPVWVQRTTVNKQQIQSVSQFILNADEKTREYFSVVIQDNQVQSLEIDEWMVLCEK